MARPKQKVDSTAQTLESLGISENEAVLYTLMLSHPASTVRELGLSSPFPRTLLYHVLNQLMRRGLVAAHKDGWRTVYVALDPERLYDLLEERQVESQKVAQSVKSLIPELRRVYHLAGKRPTVRTFEGIAEYEKALEDALVSGAPEICAFEHITHGKAGVESRTTHDARRALRKIKKRVLFFENVESLKLLKQRTYNDYTEYRSINARDVLPFEKDVTLYAGKMLSTSYTTHEPIVILVEDPALYAMQQSLFDSLWKSGKDRTLYYTEGK